MSTLPAMTPPPAMRATASRSSRPAGSGAWGRGCKDTWWVQHREASLNWLALGTLLAAWNATGETTPLVRRPEALRGYTYVSVRAATQRLERDRGERADR